MRVVDKALKVLNKKYGITNIDCVIVSGSGLSDAMPELENKIVVSYKDLGLPSSKVKGHSGSLAIGTYYGKTIAVVSRMHYYESGDIAKVRLPLEIMGALGAKQAVLLTSCGGLNKEFEVGDIMLIADQINMSGINPLIGMDEIKFVDMSDCYSVDIRKKVKKIAKAKNVDIKEGVFCQMSGPSYETMAEVNMLRKLGADAVSMSTAHDCIIANYLNMKVVGFSAIVNVFHKAQEELTHEEVLQNANKISNNLKIILSELLK